MIKSDMWRTIDSAPMDGTHFLAWQLVDAEEFDEDGDSVGRSKDEDAVVAYALFGTIVTYPFNGSICTNVWFTHWMPLPGGPVK